MLRTRVTLVFGSELGGCNAMVTLLVLWLLTAVLLAALMSASHNSAAAMAGGSGDRVLRLPRAGGESLVPVLLGRRASFGERVSPGTLKLAPAVGVHSL
jgi:hypothetical protein